MSTLRYAWRSIAKHPLYLTLSTVTLGLGIGVCVSNFATVDALVLRPLLLPDVDRLVIIGRESPAGPNLGDISPADYYAFADQLTTVERFSGHSFDNANVSNDGAEPESLHGPRVSAGFFSTLGVQPLLGRGFLPGEDQMGAARVAVLNERIGLEAALWIRPGDSQADYRNRRPSPSDSRRDAERSTCTARRANLAALAIRTRRA